MLRSSAKNHNYVTIATDPSQYEQLLTELRANGGATTLALRKRFAARAFALSASYDSAIASWFGEQLGEEAPVVNRAYTHERTLKYGCNPHQKPASIYRMLGSDAPFAVENGTPGCGVPRARDAGSGR